MRAGRAALLAMLLLGLLVACVLSLTLGPAHLTPSEVWAALRGAPGGADEAARQIVLQVRAPRTVVAAVTGAALAVSGATLQALLRNPLAEPYILGLSGGAALGVVTAIVLGLTQVSVWTLPAAAFAGAAFAVILVLRIASSASLGFDPRVLILGGVVIGVFFNAAIMLLLSLASGEQLRSAIFWTMGSFGSASWQGAALLALPAIPAAVLLWARARDLDLLVLGEDTAAYLGTRVRSAKLVAYALASLLAAAGVAVAGVIGFVGLVVPHAVRIAWGSGHRFLLPAASLVGAAFLVLADVAARMVLEPAEIPVGVVTAFAGVPVFVWLLRREAIRP